MNPRVKSVKPLNDYQLLLEFTNDEIRFYDCKELQNICPNTLYLESKKVGKYLVLELPLDNSKIIYLTVSLTPKEFKVIIGEKITISNFLKIENEQLIVTSSFFKNKKVADKWRYNLVNNNGWELIRANGNPIICASRLRTFHIRDKIITIKNNIPVILIILESPHKNEYDGDFKPLSPANGNTGVNFEKYFISHVVPILLSLGLSLNKEKYRIYFVNPVPYQATLHRIHDKGVKKNLRNKVWNALYPECKDDFIKRIKYYSPDIILNGCTSNLKEAVQNTLDNINQYQYQSMRVSHPFAWQIGLGAFKKYD